MNLGALFVTFGLVIPAELPDKTFISCLVMASRHRPLPVWIGAALALILQTAVAVAAGRLIILLPQTAVRSVVAALFIGGAAYLLFVPERHEEKAGEQIADRAPGRDVADGEGDRADGVQVGDAPSWWRPMLATFSVVALAEFGDLTQILIANLTARYRDAWAVFIGASAAFVVVSGAGVLGGRALIRVIPLALLRRLSGVALLGLGIYSVVQLA